MALYDEERRAERDPLIDAPNRYAESSGGTKTVGFLVGLALVGFIVYMLFAASNTRTTGDAIRQTPPSPQTTTAPRTTSPPSDTTANPQSTK
jgi:hypothetical protein